MTNRERVQRGGVDKEHMEVALRCNTSGMADYMSKKNLSVSIYTLMFVTYLHLTTKNTMFPVWAEIVLCACALAYRRRHMSSPNARGFDETVVSFFLSAGFPALEGYVPIVLLPP